VASKKSNLEVDVEDSASLIMTYKNNFVVNVVMDFIRCDAKRVIEVVGSQGTITLDLILGVVKFYGQNNVGAEIKCHHRSQREDTYVRQFKHFLKLIQEKKYYMNEVNSGINALKLAINAGKSAAENEIIITG
jgi:predicted dehydrogenase